MTKRALWNLGGHIVWDILWRLRRDQSAYRGLETFRAHYAPDRLASYTPEESAQLPAFEACVNCGLCTARCVALRNLLQLEAHYAGPRQVGTGLSRGLPEFWASHDTLYYCTLCGACEAVCPVGVPIPELVAAMRQKIRLQEAQAASEHQAEGSPEYVPPAHKALYRNLKERGNIFGQDLAPWPGGEKAEYIFFVGCAFSYWERESVAATMALLRWLGVDFTVVDERCCGGPTAVVGVPKVPELAAHNRAQFERVGSCKIITACPRCTLTLSTDPAYAGLEVLHTTQFLTGYLDRLSARTEVPRLTYHDPCELARGMGEFLAAREVLRQFTDQFVEMAACREHTNCCGGGGGVRGAFTRFSIRMARTRLEEAMESGAQVLLTECPACLHNFRNARRSRDPIGVYDLSEYLAQMVGAVPGSIENGARDGLS